MKPSRGVIIAVALIGGCAAIESIAYRRVVPTGRAASLQEYLDWQRSAQMFATLDDGGKRHVIAYGPASSWLLLASGPSAYVFDNAGRLVDWSHDIGDDPSFDGRWRAQRSRRADLQVSREAVERMAAESRARSPEGGA